MVADLRVHGSFGQLCNEWGTGQRFTKPTHPWTNGQVERMNRTVKEATIKRFQYETTEELNSHLHTLLLYHTYIMYPTMYDPGRSG